MSSAPSEWTGERHRLLMEQYAKSREQSPCLLQQITTYFKIQSHLLPPLVISAICLTGFLTILLLSDMYAGAMVLYLTTAVTIWIICLYWMLIQIDPGFLHLGPKTKPLPNHSFVPQPQALQPLIRRPSPSVSSSFVPKPRNNASYPSSSPLPPPPSPAIPSFSPQFQLPSNSPAPAPAPSPQRSGLAPFNTRPSQSVAAPSSLSQPCAPKFTVPTFTASAPTSIRDQPLPRSRTNGPATTPPHSYAAPAAHVAAPLGLGSVSRHVPRSSNGSTSNYIQYGNDEGNDRPSSPVSPFNQSNGHFYNTVANNRTELPTKPSVLSPTAALSPSVTTFSASRAGITRCEACARLRPARAHHCRECGVCVSKRDHHCPWLGTCVGEHNLRAYVHFLFILAMASTMVLAVAAYYFFLYAPHRLIPAHYKLHLHIFFIVFAFAGGGLGLSVILLGRSLACLSYGVTWQEMMMLKREKKRYNGRDGLGYSSESGFDVGLKNTCTLLGVSGQGWLGILKVAVIPPVSSLFNQALHAYDNLSTDIV